MSGRCEIYLDGGICRGTDVFKALALGAKAVFVGRPVLWGLAHSVSSHRRLDGVLPLSLVVLAVLLFLVDRGAVVMGSRIAVLIVVVVGDGGGGSTTVVVVAAWRGAWREHRLQIQGPRLRQFHDLVSRCYPETDIVVSIRCIVPPVGIKYAPLTSTVWAQKSVTRP